MNQQVGRYRVIRQLGRGAMGVVYLAEDPLLGRRVAIKTIPLTSDDPAQEEILRGRLLRDARAAAMLSHPHIVPVFDVLDEGDAACLVMEYVSGESLAARLRGEPLPDREYTLRVLREMASALDYTHSRGIVHRDVKPANIMLDETGHAKIMDFGIARVSGVLTSTPTGVVLGTVEYMAPEQITGGTVDGRADQFALAAVAYEMMAGGTLFGPHTATSLAYKIVHVMPPPVHSRNAAIPPAVDPVLARALAKSPEARFASCGDFVAALDAALRASEAPTVELPRAGRKAVARGRHAMLWTAAIGGLIAAGGSAILLLKPAGRAVDSRPAAAPNAASPSPGGVQEPRPKARAAARPPASPTPRRPAESMRPSTPPPQAPEDARQPPAQPEPEAALKAVRPDQPAMKAYREAADLAGQGDYAGAIEGYTRAIAIRPLFPRALMGRGVARQRLKQFEVAIEDFNSVIRLQPENSAAYVARGACYVRLKMPPRAIADFNRALEIKPGLPAALTGKGNALLQQKRFRPALDAFNEAVKASPDYSPAYVGRAHARRNLGDVRGADEDLKKAEELPKPGQRRPSGGTGSPP